MHDFWFSPQANFISNMENKDRKALIALSDKQHYHKGDYIFQVGDPGKNVYLLADGRAKISQLSSTGKEMILWFCLPGEIFGLAELPRGGMREVFAQACTHAEVYVINRDNFNAFLYKNPGTAMQVIDLLSCRMRVLGYVLMNLATDDVTSRIIKLILRLGAPYPHSSGTVTCLQYPMTHQEIADMVGASRQTVTGVLGNLKKKGVVSMERQRIYIENHEELERLLSKVLTESSSDVKFH